jgi:hypothetical protein
MSYMLVVFDRNGRRVFTKLFEGVSGTFMHEIANDYKHKGGPGGYVNFYAV